MFRLHFAAPYVFLYKPKKYVMYIYSYNTLLQFDCCIAFRGCKLFCADAVVVVVLRTLRGTDAPNHGSMQTTLGDICFVMIDEIRKTIVRHEFMCSLGA